MVALDRTNSVVQPVVDIHQPSLSGMRVSWFVEEVVTHDPRVALIMSRDLLPQPYKPVLEVFVPPEASIVYPAVGVPAATLPSRCGVHIDNSVDGVLRAD